MASFTGDAIASPQQAASLLALGIAPLRGKFVIRVGEVPNDQQILYRFEDASNCGLYQTRDMIRAWRDPSWPAANPGHPLAAMLAMWAAFRTTATEIQQARAVPAPRGAWSISDRLTASAMQAAGCPLIASAPFTRHGNNVAWHFMDTFQARQISSLFADPNSIIKEPDSTLSYLSAAALNWRNLVRNIKEAAPFVVVRHKDSHIAVGAKSSLATQDKFGQLLEGKWRP